MKKLFFLTMAILGMFTLNIHAKNVQITNRTGSIRYIYFYSDAGCMNQIGQRVVINPMSTGISNIAPDIANYFKIDDGQGHVHVDCSLLPDFYTNIQTD